ncbi:MAG: LamG domain-containing protein [Bacteroidota bacterium]
MRQTYSYAALLLLLPLFAMFPIQEHPSYNFDDDLVAYYSFNQCDAQDDTNNGSDGQLYGSVGCRCGIEGEGLVLDGAQDYIEFSGRVNHYFNTTDFTVSFYIKTNEYSVFRQSLLSKRELCDEYNMLDILLDRSQGGIEADVHETPTKDYPDLFAYLNGGGWVHFALVRRGTVAYTYINGVKQKRSMRCSGVDIGNLALLSFGNSPCVGRGGARRFKGVLDELRVYSRALSEEEVAALYARFPVDRAENDCLS